MAEGHRKRLVDKALNNGLDSFEQHEFLEMLLFTLIPRINTNPIAHELIDRFGSFYKACNAPISELVKVSGIGEQTAKKMKRFSVLVNEYRMSIYSNDIKITDDNMLGKYAMFLLNQSKTKEVYAFCLSSRNDLIKTIYIADLEEMTKDDIKEFIEKIVTTSATQVVLASNQIEDTYLPSDSEMTVAYEIKKALSKINIDMRNHIITNNKRYISVVSAN